MNARFDALLAERLSTAADAVRGVLDAFDFEPAQDCHVLAEALLFILLGDYDPRDRAQVLAEFNSLVTTMLEECLGRIDAANSVVKRERRSNGNVIELKPGMLPS